MANKDRSGQVLAAVRRVLAADVSEDDRRRADAFLQTFQKTADAIPISLTLLMQENGTIASHEQLFLVNTIYRALCTRGSKDNAKYQHRKEDQLPISPSQLVVFCFQQLCRHVYTSFSQQTSMNIVNQFACCVTVCILGSTESMVLHTLDQLGSQERLKTTDSSMLYCIEMATVLVLKLIPEEVQNKRLLLRSDHRVQWEVSIKSESTAVHQTLEQSWQALRHHNLPASLHTKMEYAIFRGFGTWVEHGQIAPVIIANSILLSACLEKSLAFDQIDASEQLFEVIRDVIHVCTEPAHQPLILVLMKYTIHLGPHAIQALPPALLVQVAATVADCGQEAIACDILGAANIEESLWIHFLDILLSFTSHQDIEVSSKMLDFWVDLREFLAKNICHAKYEPYVQEVMRILLHSTEYKPNFSEEFGQYRKEIRTVFRSLTQPNIAYQHQFIRDLVSLFFEEYSNAKRLTRLEVYLHALSSMAKAISDSDDTFVFRVLECIARLATSLTVLDFEARSFLCTSAVFLSVLHNWASQQPMGLPFMYAILSKCFECPEEDTLCPMRVAEDHIGAVALVKISSQCGHHMAASDLNWLQAMQDIYRAHLAAPIMTDKSFCLVLEAYAIVAAIPKDNYYEASTPAIVEICGIAFEQIEQSHPQSHLDQAQANLHLVLGHLQTLAGSLRQQTTSSDGTLHPMLHVFQLNWSMIQSLFTHSPSISIQSKISVVLSTLFRTIGQEAAPLALVAIPMLLEAYGTQPLRCFIDGVASTLHCSSDNTPDINRLLILTFSHLTQVAPHIPLQDGSEELAGLLDFVILGGTKQPHILAQSQCFESFFSFVMDVLAQGCTNSSIFTFLQATWRWYHEKTVPQFRDQIQAFVSPRMVQLLQRLLISTCHLQQTAEGSMDEIADTILHATRSFDAAQMAHWAHLAIQDSTFPRSGISIHVKKEFVQLVSSPDVATARKIRRLLKQMCK